MSGEWQGKGRGGWGDMGEGEGGTLFPSEVDSEVTRQRPHTQGVAGCGGSTLPLTRLSEFQV